MRSPPCGVSPTKGGPSTSPAAASQARSARTGQVVGSLPYASDRDRFEPPFLIRLRAAQRQHQPFFFEPDIRDAQRHEFAAPQCRREAQEYERPVAAIE